MVFRCRFSRGRGPVGCGSYRAIELLEHVVRVIERVFEIGEGGD